MRRNIQTLLKFIRKVGPGLALLAMLDAMLEQLTSARILLVIWRKPEQLMAEKVDILSGYRIETWSGQQMADAGGYCRDVLNRWCLGLALLNKDQCVVVLKDGEVVNSGWVSDALTFAYQDLWIRPTPGYLYGYNTVTEPAYRGRGLNRAEVLSMGKLLAVPQGKGLVIYIGASNVYSILSNWNPGFQRCGLVFVWPRGKTSLTVLASPACGHGQVLIERQPDAYQIPVSVILDRARSQGSSSLHI